MKRSIIILIITCFIPFLQLTAQSFYDLNTVQDIKITFAQSNWDALLDAEKAGDENYIMAQSIVINGVQLDSVGVKYKGNSTYNANQIKNPFHIELDAYKDQDYDGYTDIKLSNAANDPSFLREVLSYQIIRQYMDAPLSNYANVYINGTLIGLYSNSEAVSKKFLKSRFDSKKNTFVKCNPPAGAGPNSSDYPNMVYLGQDSSAYYDSYELKSDDGWQELIDLCDTLKNNVTDIERILDVNRTLWMLALDNALVNLDSYIGQFSQNYYLYRDKNDRFIPIIWDLNESFGRFSQTGSSSLTSTTTKQQMDHLLHVNDADFPLINKLLSIPRYKRMYLAHYKTILLENFDNNSYYTSGLELQTVIDDAVNADNNKFFTYNNFISNLTTDITAGRPGPGSSSTPGITSLMDGRSSYLLALTDFNQTEPIISDITISKENPVINETVYITASIENATNAYLGFRSKSSKLFEQLQMFDDGAHNDGTANDGIYGVGVKPESTSNHYYIYADNDNAGIFSPKRAEFDYHLLSATYESTSVGDLVINELMASNNITVADQDGEFDDWIELYNNSDIEINLEGYHLSDDPDSLLQWVFPAGATIAPNGYFTIWADKDIEQLGWHANFKLSSSSETVFLSDATGVVLDEVSYKDQSEDISYGRITNGTGNFQLTNPTFGTQNQIYTSVDKTESQTVKLTAYPNPSTERFTISINGLFSKNSNVTIYRFDGSLVYQHVAISKMQINTSGWQTGLYIIGFENTYSKIMVY